jgi:hypothetical protein
MAAFKPLVLPHMRSRGHDRYGSGQPGASRDHGSRSHKGLDVLASPGQEVYSPITGNVIREAFPYRDDHTLRGILIRGTGEFSGYEAKLFYVNGLFSGAIVAGGLIGHAMNLSMRYPGISNHIHLEVTLNGVWVDPRSCFPFCF